MVIFLVHPEVRGWNASTADVDLLAAELPGYRIIVAESMDDFLCELATADVALTWKYKQEWVEQFPGVRVVGTPAAGNEYLPAQLGAGMTAIHGSFHGITMSETAIGMMLDHARRITEADNRMKRGEPWPRAELDLTLRSLTGSHVAILGFGAIGMLTARRLKAFDCRITGVRRSLMASPDFFSPADQIISFERFTSLLPSVDHLLILLPETSQTTDLIDIDILRELPAHAGVYNLGRGNAIVEADLVQALEQRLIAGAYLDVFQEEPLPVSSQLRRVKNLYMMPHASAISPDYMRLFFRELPAKLEAALGD